MDSILEKITLYDVLGYFVPGSLVMLSVSGLILSSVEGAQALYTAYQSLFVYGFIVVSYICGILLSEIGRKITNHVKSDWQFPLPEDKIIQALSKAGVIDVQEERSGGVNVSEYMKQMYNDIQSDSEYKRLHNYASAEVLYKNLVTAIPVSAAVLCLYFPQCLLGKGVVLGLGLFAMWIAWSRSRRFYEKKQAYTVCCYVEKYLRVR